MTPVEINEIAGMNLERLIQARKELACVNVNAKNMAKDLEIVAEVLRGNIEGNCTSGFFVVQLKEGPKNIQWLDLQKMSCILGDRERLTEEIAVLEKMPSK